VRYNELGDTGLEISAISLGGHEYFEGGVRGFNPDERDAAVAPGINLEGFGGEQRIAVVREALEQGINFFDVTIDEEKNALGKTFRSLDPEPPVYVQTRPAGMVYSYGTHNEGLAEYERLRDEVERVLDLLQRDVVDVLNFGFERAALEHNPDFFERVGENVERLKSSGLIRCGSADAPGVQEYRSAIRSGAFDSISIGYHIASREYDEAVLPLAEREDIGVVTRAVFMKGALFEMADEAGIESYDDVARASIRWALDTPAVTSVIVGVDTPDQLTRNLQSLETDGLTAEDRSILDRIRETERFQERVSG
jgi:aryl-alcohol dehydrogenase-like predicted oxidoreductase